MNNRAIYAGTFDPITFGHIDVIERAVKMFSHIIVAVAANPGKKPSLPLEKRLALVKEALCAIKTVSVMGFDTLLLDFAKAHEITIILRGLRTVTDFDYEFQLASMNRQLNPAIETIFLMPSEKYMSISSSLIREIAHLGGDVSAFVPEMVKKALLEHQ